jgi:hypothetical protein
MTVKMKFLVDQRGRATLEQWYRKDTVGEFSEENAALLERYGVAVRVPDDTVVTGPSPDVPGPMPSTPPVGNTTRAYGPINWKGHR